MKYDRLVYPHILENIGKKPILILYGARQVGKTTLLKTLQTNFAKTLWLDGDDHKDAALLEHRSKLELAQLVSGYDLVIIDEAQRIKDIGISLKLIADNVEQVKVIASGSSSFELANRLSEPLTGRNRKFHLHPLSLAEIVSAYGLHAVEHTLGEYLTFGMYPQVVSAVSRDERARLIKELASDYLFKDLFMLGDIRNPHAFAKLVELLALRIGSEVSYSELAKEVEISRETVLNYITLLEQAFIIFRLRPFYTNKTKEVNKSHKIYFYDVGMRNALISNTDPIELRTDKGAIFENFFIAEKMKQRSYAESDYEAHFWRSRQGAEIDFVEVGNGGRDMRGYECKWKGSASPPLPWRNDYPHASFTSVTAEDVVRHLI